MNSFAGIKGVNKTMWELSLTRRNGNNLRWFVAMLTSLSITGVATAQEDIRQEIVDGIGMLQAGNLASGIPALEESLFLNDLTNTEQALAIWNLGKAYSKKGKDDLAVGYYNHALWLSGLSGNQRNEVYSDKAEALFKTNFFEEAQDNFSAALKGASNNTSYMFNRAVSSLKLNDFENARQDFIKVLEYNDDLAAVAEYGVSLSLLGIGDSDTARSVSEHALNMDPELTIVQSLVDDLKNNKVDLESEISEMKLASIYLQKYEADIVVDETPQRAIAGLEYNENTSESEQSNTPVSSLDSPASVSTALEKRTSNKAIVAKSDDSVSLRGVTEENKTNVVVVPVSSKKVSRLERRTKSDSINYSNNNRISIPLINSEIAAAESLRISGHLTAAQAARVGRVNYINQTVPNNKDTLIVLGKHSTPELARAAWRVLVSRNSDILGGLNPDYTQASQYLGVFFDTITSTVLTVGPFNSNAARSMCVSIVQNGFRCSFYNVKKLKLASVK